MRRWLQGMCLAAVVASGSMEVAAEVSAAVEPRIIDELDTTRLTIRATGSNQTQRLDLKALEADFEVLTTQSASQYRSVNGRVESWVEYQIMLRPRHAGDIPIPPIRVGGEATEPLTLRVRGIAPELQDAIDRMVFFEVELTTNPVYVQSQTVMVRRLYYSSGAQIYSDLPGTPDIPEAIVMPLGETTSSATVRDGQRYGVIEQQFAIFPERSGDLTIPAISVTSSVRLQMGGRTRRSGVRIATEPVTLKVLPIPADYPADRPWLPAEDLALDDTWSPVGASLAVGDPVRRTLRARVEGNVSSAIPPLQPLLPDDHFKSYPEPPQLDNDSGGGTMRGRREQAYAIIPTVPGVVDLAPIDVVWWDVNRQQVRIARSSGRTLRITGTASERGSPDQRDAEPADRAQASSAAGTQPAAPTPDVDVRRDQVPWPGPERRRILWWSLLGLAAVMVLAWVLRGWMGNRAVHHPPGRGARWRTLKRACAGADADAIHQALLGYLKSHYRLPQAESVQQFRRAGHGDVLDALNSALFGPDTPPVPVGRQVLDAVRDIRRRSGRGPDGGEALPALYD